MNRRIGRRIITIIVVVIEESSSERISKVGLLRFGRIAAMSHGVLFNTPSPHITNKRVKTCE